MRGIRYERLVHMRTTVFVGILLAVSGIIVLARDARPRIDPPLGHQDTTPPSVSLNPGSLDFGDQVVGRGSNTKRITVTNTGGKPLYVDSVTISGDTSSDFSVVKDTCTGATVAPQRACIIDVIFEPSETDERDASLKLTDNAPGSPQTMSLTGNGINSEEVPPFAKR